MKHKRYIVDGRFLSSMSTGVDRYAYQILKELDKLLEEREKKCNIAILVPANAKNIPDYKNIKVIASNKEKHWTQLVFGPYSLIHGYIPVNLCNEASVIARKGIVCLHDVCYAETEDVFPYVNEFPAEEIAWFKDIYKRIIKKARTVITVSEFSKERIVKLLGVDEKKVTVIGNGWQHFMQVGIDESVFNEFPEITKQEYFFTLTSANKNKNLSWILEASKCNLDERFVVAGKNLEKNVDFKEYPNVTYVGFATDEMAKTLMKYCKGFIFPSYYEGFGIPPLEALSTGAMLIVSNKASLPEIFKDVAVYISPDNAQVDMRDLWKQLCDKKEQKEDINKILEMYSWEKSALKLYDILVQ